jgi:UDP-N-acetylglucosamine 4-epimerase
VVPVSGEPHGGQLPAQAYSALREHLQRKRYTWLVTGVAGFVGSNLLQALLGLGQRVTGLDNFITGFAHNLDDVRRTVSEAAWKNFRFIEGDIRDPEACRAACEGVDFVLHQAALGSVARSILAPQLSNDINIGGFLAMLAAARGAGVRRFVYASSSSIYGDHPALPKVEAHIGQPLSPYALTKRANEQYAEVFARCYGTDSIGLRYFNLYGPRQDPHGEYAAVIPQWLAAMISAGPLRINGDGETSRDFCYVENAVQANLLAALAGAEAGKQVYNVAAGGRTSLNTLFEAIRAGLAGRFPHLRGYRPEYGEFRAGDVRHSQADISKAAKLLHYVPTHGIEHGLPLTMAWYIDRLAALPR